MFPDLHCSLTIAFVNFTKIISDCLCNIVNTLIDFKPKIRIISKEPLATIQNSAALWERIFDLWIKRSDLRFLQRSLPLLPCFSLAFHGTVTNIRERAERSFQRCSCSPLAFLPPPSYSLCPSITATILKAEIGRIFTAT